MTAVLGPTVPQGPTPISAAPGAGQIGEELFITQKTASVHVPSILVYVPKT